MARATNSLPVPLSPVISTGVRVSCRRETTRSTSWILADEPTIPETVRILQGLRSRYEGHHRVKYADDALEAAAKLASRHLRDYRLPDSAIDVLDEAGARARLAAPATPKGETVAIVDVAIPQIEEVVARMARIPAKQASSSDCRHQWSTSQSNAALRSAAQPNGRFWHKADMLNAPMNVRYRGQGGRERAVMSANDMAIWPLKKD